jgi:hypothetical protein
MTQPTYQLPLTFEQILILVLQLSTQEQEQLIQEIQKYSLKHKDEDLLNVFDRIGRNARRCCVNRQNGKFYLSPRNVEC